MEFIIIAQSFVCCPVTRVLDNPGGTKFMEGSGRKPISKGREEVQCYGNRYAHSVNSLNARHNHAPDVTLNFKDDKNALRLQ